ncbi:DUF3413 domain-containing protein [Modicisalibacter tunisiensis]|uniref:DUF3413 domain-containing protein n=1 Tax=Modicisalibacter tunisiensis TaxID=390637 RepID=UPI001CCA6182|nr:DUF3413 domain-containing protein [Modicisalibacter tunisiensis]MBZ9537726.1 DUF3413 domain-containing protein [Modicisalibacter tunisiensis]
MNSTRLSSLRQRLRGSLAFALVNLVAVWLIALRYTPFLEVPHDPLGIAYLIVTWVGHFGFLALLAWLPLAVLALILPRRVLWLPASLLAMAGLCLMLVDTVVFAQYRFHINHFMVSLFLNDKNGEIFSFTTSTWLVVAGVSLGVWLAEAWLAWRLLGSERVRRLPLWRGCSVLLLALVASHAIHIVADARYQRSVTQQVNIFPLLFPATAKSFMEAHGWLDPRAMRAARADITHDAPDDIDWPKAPLQCSPGDTPPNVLLVLVDTWRHDEYGPRNTPVMVRELKGDSRRFMNHYSGGNSTRTGVMSLFYSLTGNYYHRLQNSQTPSLLLEQLQANDYRLGIFASASLDSVGFDRSIFSSVTDLRDSPDGDTPAERDRLLTQAWLDWQARRRAGDAKRPWFGMVFYDAPHGYSVPKGGETPFQPSASSMNYLDLGPDTDPEPYFNLHRNAVYNLDQRIGRVIEDLKRHGEWQNTLVIVTGDHGESFNDFGRNYWGHNSHFAAPQTEVPMIVHGPGVTPGEHRGTTSHMDVVPMLMRHVLGCSNPVSDYAQGQDLLKPGLDHDWVTSSSYLDNAVIEDDRITVINTTGGWRVVDRQLNPLEETISPAVRQAMQEMRAFYAR